MHRRNYAKAINWLAKSVERAEELPRTQYREFYAAATYYTGVALRQMGKTKQAVSYFKAAAYSQTEGSYKEKAQQKLKQIKQ